MYTRRQIETAADQGTPAERYQRFLECGSHRPIVALPLTSEGVYFCPQCCTLLAADGQALNAPPNPKAPTT
jgi:hypothetical protein